MSQANKRIHLRWFEELWSRRPASAIDEMMADDGVVHGTQNEEKS
jgi:hypothetical protein